MPSMPSVPGRLGELARTFTWLGLTAFGGPAAHIAIMQRELVERRGWLTPTRFVDLLGLSSLLPGPSSTEVALGIGFERGRWAGLLVAGLGFILPASLLVLGLAILYEAAGGLAQAGWLLYGMAPVVIAVIAHAMIRLVPTAFTDAPAWLIGDRRVRRIGRRPAGARSALSAPIVVLLGGALAMLAVRRCACRCEAAGGLPWPCPLPGASVGAAARRPASASAPSSTFLKMGVVVFGSGYVLVAFLGSELVAPGYITQQELLDAIAIGQLTPGPVFTTATFIGYLLAGVPGAVVATVGIFLPAFVLVGVTHPFLPRLRANADALDGHRRPQRGRGRAHRRLGRVPGPGRVHAGGRVDALVVVARRRWPSSCSWRGRLGPVPLLLAGALVGLLARTVTA